MIFNYPAISYLFFKHITPLGFIILLPNRQTMIYLIMETIF
jgi:hypothetical protein